MPRRAKPAKAEVEARRPVARKSLKSEASKRRELHAIVAGAGGDEGVVMTRRKQNVSDR